MNRLSAKLKPESLSVLRKFQLLNHIINKAAKLNKLLRIKRGTSDKPIIKQI